MAGKPVSPETAEAINRKKARYGRYTDTKQWAKYEAEVALPEATYDYCDECGKTLLIGGKELKMASSREFTDFFGSFFAEMQTLHLFGSGDFETTDKEDEVRAVFSLEDRIYSKQLGTWAAIWGGGHYYEVWKRVDGDWFLKDLRMERTFQKMTFLVKVAMFLQNKLGLSLL